MNIKKVKKEDRVSLALHDSTPVSRGGQVPRPDVGQMFSQRGKKN